MDNLIRKLAGGSAEQHSEPSPLKILLGLFTLVLVYILAKRQRPYPGIPVARLPQSTVRNLLLPERRSFITEPAAVLAIGRQISNGCFQVRAAAGWKIIVPNRFAEELRNDPNLTVAEFGQRDFLTHFAGFDGIRQGFRTDNLLADVVRIKLTQSSASLIDTIVAEADSSIRGQIGDIADWETFPIRETLLDIISRISSRIFLGPEVGSDPRWLRVAKQNAIDTFVAAYTLHMIPSILRPALQWVIPACSRNRGHVREAHKVLEPQIKSRLEEESRDTTASEKPKRPADAFSWMIEVSKGRKIDFVGGQMFLTLAGRENMSRLRCGMLTACSLPHHHRSYHPSLSETL